MIISATGFTAIADGSTPINFVILPTMTVDRNRIDPLLIVLFIASVCVNLFTINIPFFTDDPGLYASIAKQLIYQNDFFQLFSYGRDWLDKPHMPFWLIMFSFKLFGISTWSYKLPALICYLLSLLYTWLFAKRYYGKQTAMLAVLILSSALHLVMSNTDVRAEPYLMAFIIGAIYHISEIEWKNHWGHLTMAALLTAAAIMTKGVFVVVPIYGALAGQLILQKRWRELAAGRWWVLVFITIIFTSPELYSLYIQFDLHPEKTVFNRHGVSGIKWFLWDSQFGRFANDGPITRQQGDVFFFLHTLLWAFAPWCLLFYFTVYKLTGRIIKRISQPEFFTYSGALLLLLLFSLSGFQLPFYTNILFPLFAISTAHVFESTKFTGSENTLKGVSLWPYLVTLPVVIITLHIFLKPDTGGWVIYLAGALFIGLMVYLRQLPQLFNYKLFVSACTVMLLANLYIGATLYPLLAANKGQIPAAEYINKQVPASTLVYSLKDQNNIFQFYTNRPVRLTSTEKFTNVEIASGSVFYADQESIDQLKARNANFETLATFSDYPQENILSAFINKGTRATTLAKVYIIQKR